MPKAEKIAKEIALAEKKRQSKPCKHGFGLTHRTCAYCQGHPVSKTSRTSSSPFIQNLAFVYEEGGDDNAGY